jgi:hypothetical protein
MTVCSWGADAARAQVSSDSSSVPSTTPTSVGIYPGFAFTGGDIAIPGSPNVVRHLDAYQSAVFVQSWFGAAVTTRVKHEKPPTRAHIYRVAVTGSWDGAGTSSTRAVYIAIDGARAWVAWPGQASASLGSLDWWVAPDRVVSAFNGTEKLVPTGGTDALASTTTTVRQDQAATHSGNGGTSALGVILAAAIAGIVAIVVIMRARRRATHR